MNYGPKTNTNGLLLSLDAGNLLSYPGTGTTWTDLAVLGGNGTLTNGPTFSATNGGSIVFDGTNDCVVLPTNSAFNFGTGDFSIFCWIKTSKVSGYGTIFCLDDTASGNGIIFYSNITTGVFSTYVAGAVLNSAGSIANDTWNHVGITRSSGTVYQYINGVQVGSFSAAGSVLTNQIPRFGNANNNNSNMFQGNIAMAQIYNRALTATEVYSNYFAVKTRFDITVVKDGLLVSLDAGSPVSYPGTGTTWTDLSGNGNNGTLTNGPTFDSANGGSIVFDGTNDYVTGTITNVSVYTFSMFVKIVALKVGGGLFCGTGGNLGMQVGGGNTLQFENVTTSFVPTAGQWYHFAGVQTTGSSNQILYINGASYATNTGSTALGSGYTVGRREVSGPIYLNCQIATTHIYNRALSASEILQNYNTFKNRFGL